MREILKKCLQYILCLSVLTSVFFVGGCKEPEKNYMYNGKMQKVEDSEICLVEGGSSEYSILLRDEYDIAEAYAAEEFNRLL